MQTGRRFETSACWYNRRVKLRSIPLVQLDGKRLIFIAPRSRHFQSEDGYLMIKSLLPFRRNWIATSFETGT